MCPLGRVFRMAESVRGYASNSNVSAVLGIANLWRSIVNFRYSGGWMHIALNVWMADSRSIKPAISRSALCSNLDVIKQRKSLGGSGRKPYR